MTTLTGLVVQLTAAFLLALITERITAALVAPVKAKWPELDLWWVIYPAWVLGGVLAYLANLNLVADLLPTLPAEVGRVLTAVIVGGGSNLIHDIFDRPATSTVTASTQGGSLSADVKIRGEPLPDTPQKASGGT